MVELSIAYENIFFLLKLKKKKKKYFLQKTYKIVQKSNKEFQYQMKQIADLLSSIRNDDAHSIFLIDDEDVYENVLCLYGLQMRVLLLLA